MDSGFNIVHEIEKNIRLGIPPYIPQLQPHHDQLMGRILLAQGNFTKSEEYLQKAFKDTTPYNARMQAWIYHKMEMISSDARGEGVRTEDYYHKTLNVQSREEAVQIQARKYLKKPYVSSAKKLAQLWN